MASTGEKNRIGRKGEAEETKGIVVKRKRAPSKPGRGESKTTE